MALRGIPCLSHTDIKSELSLPARANTTTKGAVGRWTGTRPLRPTQGDLVQNSLTSFASFDGFGLHGGNPVRMVVHPAAADHGIWFRRTDVAGRDPLVRAHWSMVTPSRLCTVIENASGVSVSTIEHVMAALAGSGVHNALVDIDGPEVPILDGSAVPFVEGFLAAGVSELAAPLRAIRVLKPVEVRDGAAVARLEPAEMLEIDFNISFADAAIGDQSRRLNMANGAFVRELSDSRTFCRQSDVDAMRKAGLARGGSLENAVVFDEIGRAHV